MNWPDNDTLALLVALATVVISPIAQYCTTRLQVVASTISNNRKLWIDAVRDEVAGVLGLCMQMPQYIYNVESRHEQTIGWISGLTTRVAKLELLLNPNEADHRQLIEAANNLLKLVVSEEHRAPEVFGKKIKEQSEMIIRLSQPILKREWNRVKKLN